MKAGCCQNGSVPAPHSMEGKERHGKKRREKKGLCVYFFPPLRTGDWFEVSMFAHQGDMMDEGTAGGIAEINNKGIIAMCLITGRGRTRLGLRWLSLQGVFRVGCFPGPLWWVPVVGCPKNHSQIRAAVIWVFSAQCFAHA